MKKIFFIAWFCLLVTTLPAQTVSQKIQQAFLLFEKDAQLKHGISSLYVADAKTGKVVFDKNSQVGLAPASTQKIITAAASLELLGHDFKYPTILSHDGKIINGVLEGNIIISGTGDPTLGSWRYASTIDSLVLKTWAGALLKKGIKKVTGNIIIDYLGLETQQIPDGWIWQDIGNYYGAGQYALNWKENQYDLYLQSPAKTGEPVEITGTSPAIFPSLLSEVKAGLPGSGDSAYIYVPVGGNSGRVRGSIPVNQKNFKISGAHYYPSIQLAEDLGNMLRKAGIEASPEVVVKSMEPKANKTGPGHAIHTYYSPALDSIIYWFLQKSINLYGEAMLKTLAYEKSKLGSTAGGLTIIKDFWKQKGISMHELNISDGSGLSPQNRVTTHAQVEILKYARKQSWFPYFYRALPEFNNMKMKSGTIRDVKGFCGYHQSRDGREYVFSFLVNNYNGSTAALVTKMYRVLNVLK